MILNDERTRHQSTTRIADLAALECHGHKVPWLSAWTSGYPSSLVKIESEGFLLPLYFGADVEGNERGVCPVTIAWNGSTSPLIETPTLSLYDRFSSALTADTCFTPDLFQVLVAPCE